MKKTFITKILILCLCFLMLFSGATVFASAAEDENSSIEWSMDKNAEYLYGNGKRYDRYYANGEFYGDARKAYYFKNKVSVNGTMCEVYGDSPDPHIVSVRYTDGYSYVFTDGEGRRILENFQNGKEVIYYLEQANYKYTVIDSSLADSLDTAYNLDDSATTMTVAVNTLTDASIYELTAHDSLEMKAYQNGAIYCMPNGTTFYVCFKYLDNSYFDADGYFSYRKGYVKALVLDSDLKNEVENALRYMETKPYEIVYEHLQPQNLDKYPAQKTSSVPFWIFYSLFGFLLPLPLLIIGLVKAGSKKLKTPKMWYSLAISAGVWILSAIALLLLLAI